MIFVLYNRSTFPAMIVWASAAVSLDGYIDDTTSRRLVLSGTKDWEPGPRFAGRMRRGAGGCGDHPQRQSGIGHPQ